MIFWGMTHFQAKPSKIASLPTLDTPKNGAGDGDEGLSHPRIPSRLASREVAQSAWRLRPRR